MKSIDVKSIQIQFLNRISDLIPKETSMAAVLSDMFEVSNDSAYRRMRGETPLSIEEIIILCEKFNISFDAFSRKETGLVTFKYSINEPKKENLLEYLHSIYNDLQVIANSKTSKIIYACGDIPVFYHYKFPEIASFKFFYWMKSIMNVPEFENATFNFDDIDPEIINIGLKIVKLYEQVPSQEIWTDSTIYSTLKQIDYYWESGMFENAEDAIKVCDSLAEVIKSIQKCAENSTKIVLTDKEQESIKNYELYYSDIEIINNCVLVKLEQTKAVYLSHFSFFTMSTMNDVYAEKTEQWLNVLIKRSLLLSGVAEKQRYQFFKRMFKQIDNLKAKILPEEKEKPLQRPEDGQKN